MLASAGIILLLIALTGFYVAAEFGAVGVRRLLDTSGANMTSR